MAWRRRTALLVLCLALPALADDRIQALEQELARLREAEVAKLKAENEALRAKMGAPPATTVTAPALTPVESPADAGVAAPQEENLLANLADESPSDVGKTGSFGSRLEQLALQFDPFLHAYASIDLIGETQLPNGGWNPKMWTFDPRYFNVFVGGTLGPVHAELQLELNHGTQIESRFAQVDFEIDPRLVVRAGVFLVPFGVYNEYYYPEYVRPIPRRPLSLVLDTVVPVVWNDMGIQLRGKGDFTSRIGWNYAVYVGNGLNMAPGANAESRATNFRNMRGNYLETLTSNKAVGGRFGVNWRKLNVGVSANHGGYADNPDLFLTFLGADVSWEDRDFGVLCEYAWARVVLPSGGIYHRWGVSLQGHFAIFEWLRVGAMFDYLAQPDVDPTVGLVSKIRIAPVVAFYPAPKVSPKTSVRLAWGRSFITEGVQPSLEQVWLLQLATAF